MSWRFKKKLQRLLADEQGAVRKDWGGKIAVALVYPNTYTVGMSNLGFQTIYRHLNALPDVVCERLFLPDPEDIDLVYHARETPLAIAHHTTRGGRACATALDGRARLSP